MVKQYELVGSFRLSRARNIVSVSSTSICLSDFSVVDGQRQMAESVTTFVTSVSHQSEDVASELSSLRHF